MKKNIYTHLRKTLLYIIVGLTTTVFFLYHNNNNVLAACPTGYHAISYGPDEFCVNPDQSLPPCRPGDEETTIGQTIKCTAPEVGQEPPNPNNPPNPGNPPGQTCSMAVLFDPSPPVAGRHINIVTPKPNDGTYSQGSDRPTNYYFEIDHSTQNQYFSESGNIWTAAFGPLGEGEHYLTYLKRDAASQEIQCGQQTFSVENNTGSGQNPCPLTGYGRVCHTALGWISADITVFAGQFLSIAIGLAGGIALILLVYGSIRVLTSSGNQQSLAAGRDTIIAAVAGLLFLIFSVLILRALGILIGIPFI